MKQLLESRYYVGLCDADDHEISYSGYSRQRLDGHFPDECSDVQFPEVVGGDATVSKFGVWDSMTDGNLLYVDRIQPSAIYINSGARFTLHVNTHSLFLILDSKRSALTPA